jgi:hypothetical protein
VTVSTRGWLAGILPSLTVALLALWWPPMAMLLAANAGIVHDTGFPRLSDPGTLGSLIELMLLTAGAWLLHRNARDGWVVLAWSRGAAFLRLTWGMLVLSRLNGIAAALHERVIWDGVAMLVVSGGLLAYVRSEFVGPPANEGQPRRPRRFDRAEDTTGSVSMRVED